MFVITTDGMENASRRYYSEKVKQMIERQKEKYGWEFLFLGANIDAAKEAEKIGIARNRSVTYENDEHGIALNYETVGSAVKKMAKSRNCSAELDDDWADEIAEYHKQQSGE